MFNLNRFLILIHHIILFVSIYIYEWYGVLAFIISGIIFTRVIAEKILHLGISHRHIKNHKILDWVWAFFAVLLGQGSTIAWSTIHRLHHAYADTEKDPLSPFHNPPWKIWLGLLKKESDSSMVVKDLIRSPAHIFTHRYYDYLHISLCLFLFLINPIIILLIVSPGIVYSFHFLGAINTLSHMYGEKIEGVAGRNNIWVDIFALMQGTHASHHANPNP